MVLVKGDDGAPSDEKHLHGLLLSHLIIRLNVVYANNAYGDRFFERGTRLLRLSPSILSQGRRSTAGNLKAKRIFRTTISTRILTSPRRQ